MAIIFFFALLSSYYGFRRVWRDIRDGDIINDWGAITAIILWSVFYYLKNQ